MPVVSNPGYTTYSPAAVRATAQKVAEHLPRMMKALNADTVVVTGKSGVSIAYAALMLIDFPLVVVRKPTERSHGMDVEGPTGHNMKRYIVLDDLVCSGDTLYRIKESIERHVGAEAGYVGCMVYEQCASIGSRRQGGAFIGLKDDGYAGGTGDQLTHLEEQAMRKAIAEQEVFAKAYIEPKWDEHTPTGKRRASWKVEQLPYYQRAGA